MEKNYLFNTSKINYVKGKKPHVPCILCAVIENSPEVENLTIFKSEFNTVALNLYPFNPGHLMIFPNRHLERLEEMSTLEAADLHELTSVSIEIMNELFQPSGYNIGYNIGSGSGGSIAHIHEHIVPRYLNEVGYLDVLSGTRVVVSDPKDVLADLKAAFACSRLKRG